MQQKNQLGQSYYEESLVSSNLNSKLFRFHCVRPNLHSKPHLVVLQSLVHLCHHCDLPAFQLPKLHTCLLKTKFRNRYYNYNMSQAPMSRRRVGHPKPCQDFINLQVLGSSQLADHKLQVLKIFVHSVSCHFSCQKICNLIFFS